MAVLPFIGTGLEWGLYLAEETTLGTANVTDAEFYSLDLNTPVDVDWSAGLLTDDVQRTGQRSSKPGDRFATPQGSVLELSFEWGVSNKEALDLLLKLITEDATSPYEVAANASTPSYQHGQTTGSKATVIVHNPDSTRDRTLTGCLLTELSLSIDKDTAGSRLVTSGKFISGYQADISANTIVPSASTTAYAPVLADMSTVTVSGLELVLESFNCTFSYTSEPVGSQGADNEPELYARAVDGYTFEGEMTVKKDANAGEALDLLRTTTLTGVPIVVSGSELGFTIGQAVITGYTPALDGMSVVAIAFSGRGTGSENLFSITT